MRDAYHTFIALYFELEFVYQSQMVKGEGLAEYISEANPFLWDDVGSADPAIWIEFQRGFIERFGDAEPDDVESLAFVRDYLEEQSVYYIRVFPGGDETPFPELFDRAVSLAEWTDMLNDLERQDRERGK